MTYQRKYGTARMPGKWMGEQTQGTNAAARQETRIFMREFHNSEQKKRTEQKQNAPPPRIAIRPMTIDDASFVIDSWCSAYRRSQTVGPIDEAVFKIEQRARIDRLICRSKTFIACDADDKKVIRGWICFEPPVGEASIPILHFVCVHPIYQLHGIGTALVDIARKTHPDPETHIWSTHETSPMRHIRPKWNVMYNPYLLEVDNRVAARHASGVASGSVIF